MTVEQKDITKVQTPPEQEWPQRFVVDLWPTGRCDMKCPFCYGADVPIDTVPYLDGQGKTKKAFFYETSLETRLITGTNTPRPEMTVPQMQEVVSKLKGIGVTTLTIAGGEPLLRQETPGIIKFAYGIGLEIYLSTNGTFLRRHYGQVKDCLSVLGLPLDGSTPDMNVTMGRRIYLYQNIKGLLSYFKDHYPRHLVKVGTVISKLNLEDIEAIGQFLHRTQELYPPDIWRLYQFEPLKEGAKNREAYEISSSEFDQTVEHLKRTFPEAKISARSNNDHINAYFFVTPDGMLQTVDDRHRSIVDLLTISSKELVVLITNHRETRFKASKNREWLG